MTATAHPGGGGDRPMPGIAFRSMSALFRVRDLVRPRSVLLDEVPLRTGSTVVDYGCGPGSYIPELSKRVGPAGRVVAVDIHPLAIERVEGLARRRSLLNVEAHVGDGVQIPGVADGTADIVILCDIFHMLGEPQSVLAEIARVLGPDGLLVVNDPHMDPKELVAGVTRSGRFQLDRRGDYVTLFTPGKSRALQEGI